jgi:hypothetical protein
VRTRWRDHGAPALCDPGINRTCPASSCSLLTHRWREKDSNRRSPVRRTTLFETGPFDFSAPARISCSLVCLAPHGPKEASNPTRARQRLVQQAQPLAIQLRAQDCNTGDLPATSIGNSRTSDDGGCLIERDQLAEREEFEPSVPPTTRYLSPWGVPERSKGQPRKRCPFFGGPKVSKPSQCRYDSLMAPTDVPPVGSLPKPSIMDNSYVLSKYAFKLFWM